MRKWTILLAAAMLLVCVLVPSTSFTEDRDTVLLARVIYALGRDESYDTKLALGTVVMNRVENAWFASDLGDVLEEQHQFPSGSRYDAESLQAAHAVLSGTRSLPASALYYRSTDAATPWSAEHLVKTVGGYGFYETDGNL